jgi:hypothetical protein
LSQDLRALVNCHMQDYQVRLYYEIEVQVMQNKEHPVRVLITECFNEAFMQHYKQYVVKSSNPESKNELLDKII